MKHVPLTLSKYRAPVIKTYLSDLFKGLLRTTWQFPKTIWYSQRYNAGEKFLLHVPYLYPYKYQVMDQIKSKEPVHMANNLNASIENLQAIYYERNVLNNPNAGQLANEKEFLLTFNQAFFELYKSFEYNIENPKFDMPVAVSARTLYAAAYFERINNFEGNSYKEMEASQIKSEVLEFILNKFLQKIQYADAESISQVLFCLDKFNHYPVDIWNRLIQEISNRNFEPEFTKVRPHFPIFYRYHEVSDAQNCSIHLDKVGNEIFFQGAKPIYETYNAVSRAVYKNNAIQASDYLRHLEEKFASLNLKENNVKLA
jgi:hypothetical protein